MAHLSRKRFEQLVTEALKGIPAELAGLPARIVEALPAITAPGSR